MRIAVAPQAGKILAQLMSNGFAAYCVGGCVRDSLLGKAPLDWDICTSARPEEIVACFPHCRCLLTGAKYGTVTVLYEQEPFEVTTFRGEAGYSDSRHPDGVRFLGELQEDLARRDFTVNAMAADAAGQVTDLFGGVQDLQKGQLRCVGDPKTRFSEDALRMLRALRFASKLDFSVEEETAQAIHGCCAGLKAVAPERLRKELDGLLMGRAPGRVLAAFPDVLQQLIPEIAAMRGFLQYNFHHAYDVWEHSLRALDSCEAVLELRLAALFHDIGKPAAFFLDKNLIGHFYGHSRVSAAMTEGILRRLRYDGETLRRVTALVRCHDAPLQGNPQRQLRRLLNVLGETDTALLLRLRRADRLGKGTEDPEAVCGQIRFLEDCLEEIRQKELCFSLKQLQIKGSDLLAMGLPAGPKIGTLLQCCLQEVMEGRLPNEHPKLVEFAQRCIAKTEND